MNQLILKNKRRENNVLTILENMKNKRESKDKEKLFDREGLPLCYIVELLKSVKDIISIY